MKLYLVPEEYEGYPECHYGYWPMPVKECDSQIGDLSVKKIDKTK